MRKHAKVAVSRSANDEAVSPVIAVILMVAITVVLAAAVYTWVSQFQAQGTQAASFSVSAGPENAAYERLLTVNSVSAGFAASELRIVLEGVPLAFDADGTAEDGEWATRGGATLAAGDVLEVDAAESTVGKRASFVDVPANTVVFSLTFG